MESKLTKWQERNLEVFKEKVLPEWAIAIEKHKVDINGFSPDMKREFLRLFREYWENNPPF